MTPATGRRRHALLVGSAGGHLAQLLELRSWWHDVDRTWVTQYSRTSRSQLHGECIVPGHFPTTRSIPNLVRNSVLALRVILANDPDVIVSTGAGIALPFVALGRVLGIPTVFIEVFDRVESRTLTGTLCYPLTSLFVVQWPQQQTRYGRSELVGALWAGSEPRADASDVGDGRPLIVVTVGTDHHPFDRLMRWVERYCEESEVEVRLVVQHGTAEPPRSADASPWLDHPELQRLLAEAAVVIVHGGPYSIVECLRHGRKPIVVPREQRFGEAVDDHQLAFTSVLAAEDRVICARTDVELAAALDQGLADPGTLRQRVDDYAEATESSVERFRALVDDLSPSRRIRRWLRRGLILGCGGRRGGVSSASA